MASHDPETSLHPGIRSPSEPNYLSSREPESKTPPRFVRSHFSLAVRILLWELVMTCCRSRKPADTLPPVYDQSDRSVMNRSSRTIATVVSTSPAKSPKEPLQSVRTPLPARTEEREAYPECHPREDIMTTWVGRKEEKTQCQNTNRNQTERVRRSKRGGC